jgi:hypothetical protein
MISELLIDLVEDYSDFELLMRDYNDYLDSLEDDSYEHYYDIETLDYRGDSIDLEGDFYYYNFEGNGGF